MAIKELDGNVTRAAEAAKISRATFYNWMDDDELFHMAVRAIQLEVDDRMLDDAEEVIKFWLTRKLDKEVAKWVLGKKGRARGYGNRIEVEAVGAGFKGLEYPTEPATVGDWAGATKAPPGEG